MSARGAGVDGVEERITAGVVGVALITIHVPTCMPRGGGVQLPQKGPHWLAEEGAHNGIAASTRREQQQRRAIDICRIKQLLPQ